MIWNYFPIEMTYFLSSELQIYHRKVSGFLFSLLYQTYEPVMPFLSKDVAELIKVMKVALHIIIKNLVPCHWLGLIDVYTVLTKNRSLFMHYN